MLERFFLKDRAADAMQAAHTDGSFKEGFGSKASLMSCSAFKGLAREIARGVGTLRLEEKLTKTAPV